MVRSELRTKIGERVEAMRIIEALLVFPVAALYFAVVAGCVWTDQLCRIPRRAAVSSKRVGRFLLLLEKRLVNSNPLSVCTHSTRTATAF